MNRAASAPAAVRPASPQGARLAAAVRGEDEGVEPGAGDAPNRPLSGHGEVQLVRYRRHRFRQRYTRADIELLAVVDEAHQTLSRPATRRILEREYRQYDKPEYERLAAISVSHLYNLHQQPRYRERRLTYNKSKLAVVSIGERQRPDPQGHCRRSWRCPSPPSTWASA